MTEPADRLSLYRRFRPQQFADVVGQDLVVATLRRAVAGGKLGHAYLLAGQRGIGKTSVARILARAANCLSPKDGEPCNRCHSCQRILHGQSLDVVEIDGASNRGVDQIRKLREEVAYVPAGSRYKVYIIDEVHMLTGEAFNALLKTLEEPPVHVLFIFATTEPHKVPPTVVSRCQAFEFQPIADDAIARVLQKVAQAEGIGLSPGAAELIARRSRGALRDALVVLDQLGHAGPVTEEAVVELLGLPPRSMVEGFLGALRSKDAAAALGIVAELSSRGRDLALFLEEVAERARDLIIAGEAELVPLAVRLIELRAELGRAFSRRLHLELAVVSLCGAPTGEPRGGAAAPQPAPSNPAPDRAEGMGWEAMLKEVLAERPAVAAFLAPAAITWVDGLLSIRLPADCGYHYASLRDPSVQGYIEAMAHRFFQPLLAVEVRWAGDNSKPTLEEAAHRLAEALEGRVLQGGERDQG